MDWTEAFYECLKLKDVQINSRYVSKADGLSRVFKGCSALENVYVAKLCWSISFENSPLITLESLLKTIADSYNTEAITITVHPDVYAKLTGDTTNDAAGALSEEELAEWAAVMTAAVNKNIAFATV